MGINNLSTILQLDVGAPPSTAPPAAAAGAPMGGGGLLGDIFGLGSSSTNFVAPKVLWLPAVKGKGLEISGTFVRK